MQTFHSPGSSIRSYICPGITILCCHNSRSFFRAYYPLYQSNTGQYAIPMLFYRPGGELHGMSPVIASRPILCLQCLGTWVMKKGTLHSGMIFRQLSMSFFDPFHKRIYGMMKDGYLIEFDGTKSTHLFSIGKDPLQKTNC